MIETAKTTIDIDPDLRARLEDVQKVIGSEYLKDAVLHVLSLGLKGQHLEKPIECEYLSNDGSLCSLNYPKFQKTTPSKCELCERMHKQQREEDHLFLYHERQWIQICEELNIERNNPNELMRFSLILETIRKLNVKGFLEEKTQLKAKVDTMANALLERDRKIALLEDMASPKLFEENQYLKVQLAQKERQLTDYAREIEKLEALNERLQKFLPTTTGSFESV